MQRGREWLYATFRGLVRTLVFADGLTQLL